MTIPAAPSKTEISQLIDLQIQVLGQPSALTPSNWKTFAVEQNELILLGQELDQVSRTIGSNDSNGK